MEEAWTEKYPENQKEILLEWQKFELAQPDELKPFLERLINLIDPQDRIHLDEEGLILPVKYNNKTPKYWRKWISGDWFEQLIYTWFKENGVKDENLETGLQIRQEESQGNETDILLFHKNQLIFCELKSDLSSQSNLADPLRQVIDQFINPKTGSPFENDKVPWRHSTMKMLLENYSRWIDLVDKQREKSKIEQLLSGKCANSVPKNTEMEISIGYLSDILVAEHGTEPASVCRARW